jgi:nuclease S1
MPPFRPLLLALPLLSLLVSPVVLAWSANGHRTIALLAQERLSPAARAEVDRLLAAEPAPTLAGVSTWADELRDTDQAKSELTSTWHYMNFPRGDCSYVPPRDCPDGKCVIAAINRQFLILSDPARPDAERTDALKFLVHFVGDVHQPMHAGFADDRGGNDYQVSYQGKGTNLHATWDRLIMNTRKLEPADYARLLDAQPALPRDPTRSSDRPAVDWALESCRISHGPGIYPTNHLMTDEYLLAHRPIEELRLRQAGQRLADMLNFALKPAATRPAK